MHELKARAAISFADVIAPLTPGDIKTLRGSRTLKLQPRGHGAPTLLDWETFWRLIEDDAIPAQRFIVTYRTNTVAPRLYRDDGKMNPGRLASLCDQGASIIARKIDLYVPAVAAACRDATVHGIPIRGAGVITTTGRGGALQTHYDPTDIILLQVEGTKRWRIYAPREPDPTVPMSGKSPPQTAPIFDEVLRPGDLLYLPAGYWHDCENGPGRSLHMGLFVRNDDRDLGYTA